MRVFNFLVTLALLLALLGAAAAVIGITLGFIVADPAFLGDDLAGRINALAGLDDRTRAVLGTAAGVAFLVTLVLLRYELLPRRRRASRSADPVEVEHDDHGRTTIDVKSICKLVESTVQHLDDVHRVKTTVSIRDARTVALHCRVVAANTALAHELGPEIRRTATERVERQLGLTVDEVSTSIRYVPPDERVLL